MEKAQPEQNHWTHTLAYVVAWIIAIGFLVADLFLIRNVVMEAMTTIGAARAAADIVAWRYARITYGWIVDTVNSVTLLVIGCTGIALVILIEVYFRKGMTEGVLYKRIARVFGAEAVVAALAWGLSALLGWVALQLAA